MYMKQSTYLLLSSYTRGLNSCYLIITPYLPLPKSIVIFKLVRFLSFVTHGVCTQLTHRDWR